MDNGASSYLRYLGGDDEAFENIIKDYKDGLILYLNGYVNNILVAEELMEETFFKIAVKKPKFKGKSTFKTWLYAISRNVAVDYLRKSSKITYIADEKTLSVQADFENTYIKKEEKITVHNAMKKLNPSYRRVLYLIYFENFSNGEAAIIMKKNSRQIKNLLYRAKNALKDELLKENFIYEEL